MKRNVLMAKLVMIEKELEIVNNEIQKEKDYCEVCGRSYAHEHTEEHPRLTGFAIEPEVKKVVKKVVRKKATKKASKKKSSK